MPLCIYIISTSEHRHFVTLTTQKCTRKNSHFHNIIIRNYANHFNIFVVFQTFSLCCSIYRTQKSGYRLKKQSLGLEFGPSARKSVYKKPLLRTIFGYYSDHFLFALRCSHIGDSTKMGGRFKHLPPLLCSSFEMPLPAFYADYFSSAFPFLQTADRDPHFSRK